MQPHLTGYPSAAQRDWDVSDMDWTWQTTWPAVSSWLKQFPKDFFVRSRKSREISRFIQMIFNSATVSSLFKADVWCLRRQRQKTSREPIDFCRLINGQSAPITTSQFMIRSLFDANQHWNIFSQWSICRFFCDSFLSFGRWLKSPSGFWPNHTQKTNVLTFFQCWNTGGMARSLVWCGISVSAGRIDTRHDQIKQTKQKSRVKLWSARACQIISSNRLLLISRASMLRAHGISFAIVFYVRSGVSLSFTTRRASELSFFFIWLPNATL